MFFLVTRDPWRIPPRKKIKAPPNPRWPKTPLSCTLTLVLLKAMGMPKLNDGFPRCYVELNLINCYEVLRCRIYSACPLSGPIGNIGIENISYIKVGPAAATLHNCTTSDEVVPEGFVHRKNTDSGHTQLSPGNPDCRPGIHQHPY